MSRFCSDCGKPLPADSQFCEECGARSAITASGLTDFTRMRALFDSAMEIDPAQRESWLWSECQGNEPMFQKLRAMVQSSQQKSFLAPPSSPPPAAPTTGPYIGAYKLLRELGRGGMGVVYLAVRDDGTFRKDVALKLLLRENVTPEFVLRFKQERQVLAALDHPNIARILDGGDAPDGMPYYVMEYVEGKPATQYCDDQRLSLTGRIKIFQQMCLAVQYLHQNSILHRDLKPANILVSSGGNVKLLDFGIAKVVGAGSFSNPNLTAVQGQMMTPNYASPEQINGATLTPASDIYSLGIILYTLLTGRPPFSGFEDKIAKMAMRQDPQPPSANIHKDLQANESTAQLRRAMLGMLDSIVLKTLKYDPAARYASAQDLSTDLQRFLDGQPVAAHHENITKRSFRLLRRGRMAIAAGLVFLMLAGFGGWQWRRAEMQKAETAAIEAKLRGVMEQVENELDSSKPSPAGTAPKPEARIEDVRKLKKAFATDYTALAARTDRAAGREALVGRAIKYLDRVQTVAKDVPEVVIEVADAYQQLGLLLESSPAGRDAAVGAYQKAAFALERFPDNGKARDRVVLLRVRIQKLTGNAPEPTPPYVATAPLPLTPEPTPVRPQVQPRRTPVRTDQPPVVEVPPVVPPPDRPVEPSVQRLIPPAVLAELQDEYSGAESRIQIAEQTIAPVKTKLEQQGQTLNPNTMMDMAKMKIMLDKARREISAGNAGAAKDSLAAARAFADKVLRTVGR